MVCLTNSPNRNDRMNIDSTSPAWLRPFLFVVALLVIAWITLRSPQPIVSIAPPDVLVGRGTIALQGQLQAEASLQPTAAAIPAPIAGRAPVLEAGLLRLYTTDGSFTPDEVLNLAEPLDAALQYVSERTALQLSGPVNVVFDRREPCSFDGAAYTEKRTIYVYACSGLPGQRAVNILAHEFVHQLAYDRYGAAHMQADLILSEGLATWGAGKYWLGREADFRGFVQQNYAGSLLPIGSHYRDYGTIDAMNRLYYQWASLVDFVIATKGRDTFDTLYASGGGMQPNSADYSGVLGTDLSGLEREWKEWLSQ